MRLTYLVTAGNYSDYHVEGAFSTRAKAEEYIERCCPEGKVEELETDAKGRAIELHRRGYRAFEVECHRYGWESGGYATRPGDVHARVRPIADITDFTMKIAFYPADPTYMKIMVLARTEEHAIKIAKEKETQAIAEGWWGLHSFRDDPRLVFDAFALGEDVAPS